MSTVVARSRGGRRGGCRPKSPVALKELKTGPENVTIVRTVKHDVIHIPTKYPTCGRTGEPFLKSDIRVNHEQKNTLLYEEIKK